MNSNPSFITSPDHPQLDKLCKSLADLADSNELGAWPAESLKLCGAYGVFSWFIGRRYGGQEWSPEQIAQGYLRLGAACLTTTFIITQRTAATRRIEASFNDPLKNEVLPKLSTGELSSTVGISHLTTSHQHLSDPVLRAKSVSGGFNVQGFSPWVTGGLYADKILLGATTEDRRQILFLVDQESITANAPHQLMALSGSCTGSVSMDSLFIGEEKIVAGPVEQIMKTAQGAITGGSQTSTLAIALANAAIQYMEQEAISRSDLQKTTFVFRDQLNLLRSKLLDLSCGNPVASAQELRIEANSLVLRSTQAALVVAKGAGYVEGHRVGRWCREAMFFLVWSCPQPVLDANLCELATSGI